MRITIEQTGSDDDMRQQRCCLCPGRFYLGPASCLAYSEDGLICWGEVCPRCIAGGPEEIQRQLDMRARWARWKAEQETEAAEEGVEDCPTIDELLAAEAFYERARFRSAKEYDDSLNGGEFE